MAHAPAQTQYQNQYAQVRLPKLSFGGILVSEFIKFWSLLSTKILLIVAAVLIIGFDALQGFGLGYAFKQGSSYGFRLTDEVLIGMPTAGLFFGILILGSLAVLFLSSEYGTGMIRSSFSAVPRRWPVYLAKALVVGVISFIVAEISMFIGGLIGGAILNGYKVDFSFGIHGLIPSMLMGGVYVIGVTLMALGFAALIRNTAGAVIVLIAILFVVPIIGSIASMIPLDFFKHLPEYFPSNAGTRMMEQSTEEGHMDPAIAGLVFGAWTALIYVAGWFTLKVRDS